MSKPKICSMDKAQGQVVEKTEYLKEVKPLDLNMDGVKDEYFTVTRKVVKICGEMPEVSVVKHIIRKYGAYDRTSKTKSGKKMLIGRHWRSSYEMADGVTTITTSVAVPAFTGGADTSFAVKHLKKGVSLGDPVKLEDGSVRFVMNFDFSKATKWDGKEMTVDYDKIKVLVVTKDALKKARKGEKAKDGDIKEIKLADIKSIEPRSKHDDAYAQK